MSWIIYALGAISAVAISDLFRKLGSNLKDPFLSNLFFQLGSVTMAITLYLLFSRRVEKNYQGIIYAVIGGLLVSVFTTLSFKALAVGPGVSTVIPFIRVGGVILVAILGILIFKDKLTLNLVSGIILAMIGVYFIFK
ncbi:MAG: hypothetical protein ACD_12C00352G0004 [uncultured bacterium]|nr:MAG: hypothetical protein ACD_12C00352G0004 [uncultured bacterium]